MNLSVYCKYTVYMKLFFLIKKYNLIVDKNNIKNASYRSITSLIYYQLIALFHSVPLQLSFPVSTSFDNKNTWMYIFAQKILKRDKLYPYYAR